MIKDGTPEQAFSAEMNPGKLPDPPEPTQFDSEDDLVQTVNTIIDSLDSDILGYQQACQMYNSAFFEGESPVFRKLLAAALKAKFAGHTNNYWNELAE